MLFYIYWRSSKLYCCAKVGSVLKLRSLVGAVGLRTSPALLYVVPGKSPGPLADG
jgi:hypothetical protein